MRVSRWLAIACLASACNEPSVELPRDATRPVTPPAASVPAVVSTPPARAHDARADPQQGPPVPADVARAPQRYIDRSIRPLLHGRALAHRVYRGRFGPSAVTGQPTAVVLAHAAAPGKPPRLVGFAHSDDTRFDFPALQDEDDAFQRVAAVMFRDVDEDSDREVIVLVAYNDEDPQAPPYFSNVVLDWDAPQGRFVRLEQLEGEIEALATASEVTARLRALSPR